ncbi:MAG: hypothetical protein EOP50_03505 [Sphingobacteriales bacterium]|nr:MAG: hypothetical protein EOP50_03505 [Sphingobacteriales bacterium]
MRKFLISAIIIFLGNLDASSQSLLIFGGQGHNVYLGCLNCGKYESSSIWNKYGENGSKYNTKSIWNQYGTYGGKYSNYSPFNSYATYPPVLVDADGNFYGYFTANKYFSKRTNSKLAIYISENWEDIIEDTDKFYDTVFN